MRKRVKSHQGREKKGEKKELHEEFLIYGLVGGMYVSMYVFIGSDESESESESLVDMGFLYTNTHTKRKDINEMKVRFRNSDGRELLFLRKYTITNNK